MNMEIYWAALSARALTEGLMRAHTLHAFSRYDVSRLIGDLERDWVELLERMAEMRRALPRKKEDAA